MPIIRHNGVAIELTMAEMTDWLKSTPAASAEDQPNITKLSSPTVRDQMPRRVGRPGKPTAPDSKEIEAVRVKILGAMPDSQRKIVKILSSAGPKGLSTHALLIELGCSAPELSRRLTSIREASKANGLKESSLVRFAKDGKGKKWFATTLLTSAYSQIEQSPTLFASENAGT